jgi:dephospho-CoA kinase
MLLALVGLAGAGKTTAIRILESKGVGSRYYAGQVVQDALRSRGLQITPANEKSVRSELRKDGGMDVFAKLALPMIREQSRLGTVLLDAVYCVEERDFYRATFGVDLKIVAVNTMQQIRAERLAFRADRPISIEDLTIRDSLELSSYRIGEVIETADYSIGNNGPLSELETALGQIVELLAG